MDNKWPSLSRRKTKQPETINHDLTNIASNTVNINSNITMIQDKLLDNDCNIAVIKESIKPIGDIMNNIHVFNAKMTLMQDSIFDLIEKYENLVLINKDLEKANDKLLKKLTSNLSITYELCDKLASLNDSVENMIILNKTQHDIMNDKIDAILKQKNCNIM